MTNKNIDVLVIVNSDLAFEIISKYVDHLTSIKNTDTHTYYDIGNTENHSIAIRCAEAGNYQLSTEVERGISFLNPSVILLVGLAGSLKAHKADYGDVLVPNRVYSFETGVETQDGFKSHEKGNSLNYELLELAKKEARTKTILSKQTITSDKYKTVIEPIASGEKILKWYQSNTARRIDLHSENAIAVDTESIGFSNALTAYPTIKGLIIKGISHVIRDEISGEIDPRIVALENAAAFAFRLIGQLDIENKTSYSFNNVKVNTPILNHQTENFIQRSNENDLEIYERSLINIKQEITKLEQKKIDLDHQAKKSCDDYNGWSAPIIGLTIIFLSLIIINYSVSVVAPIVVLCNIIFFNYSSKIYKALKHKELFLFKSLDKETERVYQEKNFSLLDLQDLKNQKNNIQRKIEVLTNKTQTTTHETS